MRIPRVHVGAGLAEGDLITLEKPQSHYLKHVLRLESGAAVILFDGKQAVDYRGNLILEGKAVKVNIDAAQSLDNESKLDSEIIQGLARADHMDWVIQKITELGVNRISIFNAERSQSPLKTTQQDKRLAHWRGVASSACEQSGRAIIPQIDFYRDLGQLLGTSREALKLLLDFEGEPLAACLRDGYSAVSILLGPEGGLNQSEITSARSAGFLAVSLGKRVLRTETAATAALAIVQSSLGDLG